MLFLTLGTAEVPSYLIGGGFAIILAAMAVLFNAFRWDRRTSTDSIAALREDAENCRGDLLWMNARFEKLLRLAREGGITITPDLFDRPPERLQPFKDSPTPRRGWIFRAGKN